MKLIHKLMCVALFAASCDLILAVNIGGTLRLSQLMLLFVGFAAVGRIVQQGRILWPRGATALALWVLWQACSIPLADNLSIALEFIVLLVFTVFTWFAVVELYGESDWVEPLMRAYLWSYIVMGIWGALQFLTPLLFHFGLPYTTQWISHNRVARINGFMYEPSYYATYMFLGYCMFTDLRWTGAEIVRSRAMRWGGWLVVVILILSTSKTAWLCIVVDLVTRAAPRVWKDLRRAFAQLRYGRFPVPIPSRRMASMVVLGLLGSVALGVAITKLLKDPRALIQGTGIAGTAAHSYVQRDLAFSYTWEVIKQAPITGRNMGGVPVAIGALNGKEVTDMAEARLHWGFPVLLDVYAGSGLIGFIPFALFLWTNTFGAYRLARQYLSFECGKWLHALARAMILEWVLLLADQNLYRVYLWIHFSMVTLLMYYVEFGRHAVAADAAPEPSPLPALPLAAEG